MHLQVEFWSKIKGLQEVMTKNTEQAVNIFAQKIAQTFEKRLSELSEGIDAYQNQLTCGVKRNELFWQ